MLLSYMIMRESSNYRLLAVRCDKVGTRQYPCCLLPGLSSGLLGDEAVDNLAGLAFGRVL